MKRSFLIVIAALMLVGSWQMARAATEAETTAAIRKGLAWLYNNQQGDGSWGTADNQQASTGAAVSAFLSQRDKWSDRADLYQAAVDKGTAFLLNSAATVDVGLRPDGAHACPNEAASCKAVYWFGNGRTTDATGWAAAAVAGYATLAGPASVATQTGPLSGMTWAEIAQAITNGLAGSQIAAADGLAGGAWSRLIPGTGEQDVSSTQSALLALIYDESAGAVTPDVVRTSVRAWIQNAQGASALTCFQEGGSTCSNADAGTWLLAFAFAGGDAVDSRAGSALAFLNTHWHDEPAASRVVNFGDSRSMWAVYTGLESAIGVKAAGTIRNLLTNCGGSDAGTQCTWAGDYQQWLARVQNDDGSFAGRGLTADAMSTAVAVNILGSTHLPFGSNSKADLSQLQGSGRPTIPQITASSASGSAATMPRAAAQAVTPPTPTPLRKRVRAGIVSLTLSPDGLSLASAKSGDSNLQLRDPRSFGLKTLFPTAANTLSALVFGANGLLAGVARDSVLRVWSGSTGASIAALAGHGQAANAVAASPDGRFFATGGDDSRVLLWDQGTRKLSKVLYGATNFVNATAFSPDSKVVAAGSEDARVYLFDVATGTIKATLRGHSGPVDTVVFSPDGSVLASAGQDTVIHLWTPSTAQPAQLLNGHAQPVRTMVFTPDGRTLASGGEDSRILLWDVATGRLSKVLGTASGAINAMLFDPTGNFLIVGSDSGELSLWVVATGIKLISVLVP